MIEDDYTYKAVIKDLSVRAITDLSSDQVKDVLHSYEDGKVLVIGDESGSNRATRTEVKINGGKVIVHKNPLGGEGMYAYAMRFNKLDLVLDSDIDHPKSLDIEIDSRASSPTNPDYNVWDGGVTIARSGYGQHMDLAIASNLLNIPPLGSIADKAPDGLTEWVNGQIASPTS